LRYTQKKINPSTVPTKTWLGIPDPKNTFVVQASNGRQITVIEHATQTE